jgi:multidrug efflux system membrane fusion protein
MARIQQIDKVYVDVRRPASSLETLQQAVGRKSGQGQGGLPITILRSNGEAYENRGRILFSGINVDAGTGDVLLRIEVDNPGRQLLPGMFVRAVPLAHYANALSIPQQSLVRTGGKTQVWTIDSKNTAHLTPVVVGSC